jgi:hypothetical protein
MPYKLKLNLPYLGEGQKVAINGLGEFANGTHDITDEEHDLFRRLNVSNDPKTGKFVDGPTLVEAFKDRKDVTVTVTKTVAPEGKVS